MTDRPNTTATVNRVTGDKFRVITLTDHQPVQIREEQWPIIARSEWHDAGPGRACQANRKQWLLIRKHTDGRVLVYGGMDTIMSGERDIRAGELVWAGDPLVPAIRRVAAAISHMDASCDLPNLGDDAIHDLPAVDIDAISHAEAT